jgi:glycosyltransferase involved in cell wall biosynthesis
VAREQPDAILVLAGEGPSRSELEMQAGAFAGNRIRFAGLVPVQDVRKWLQASDIFALVSSLEGLPVSLIEAMAVGLPSVVSDIPANTQLVDSGRHGLVAPVQDDLEIGHSLMLLIEDEALRKRLGEEARAQVSVLYSTERVVMMYERLFADLLASKRVAEGRS